MVLLGLCITRLNSNDPLVSWLSAVLSFNSCKSDNFHFDDKNKIYRSKLRYHFSKTKNISEIKFFFYC